jgi:cytoskeletal protein RodZ
MKVSRIFLTAAGIVAVGVLGFGAVRIADAMTGGKTASTELTSSSSESSSSSKSSVKASSSSISSSVSSATSTTTSSTQSTAAFDANTMIQAIRTKYNLGTGNQYSWTQAGDVYTVEVRRDSPDGQTANLVGMYHYHLSTGNIEAMNQMTGSYE